MRKSIPQFRWIGLGALFVLGVLIAVSRAESQMVRDRILEDVSVSGHCLKIGFSFPLRYVTHYPPKTGQEIRIRLRPLQVGNVDQDALFKRETVVPRGGDRLGIDEVLYEGDIDGGPYLTVRFVDTVEFRVREERNFRGMVVEVGVGGDGDECRPSR